MTQGKNIVKNGKIGESFAKSSLVNSRLDLTFKQNIKIGSYKIDFFGNHIKRYGIKTKTCSGSGGVVLPACYAITRAVKETQNLIDVFCLLLIGGTKQNSEPKWIKGWPKKYIDKIKIEIEDKIDHMKKSPERYDNPNLKFYFINIGYINIGLLSNHFNKFADYLEDFENQNQFVMITS